MVTRRSAVVIVSQNRSRLLFVAEEEMKLTWKNKNNDKNDTNTKRRRLGTISVYPSLPFDTQNDTAEPNTTPDHLTGLVDLSNSSNAKRLADSFRAHGTKLAEEGKYREALGKWENALTLMPETQSGALHEQKAQVLLEIGDAWSALKAATRATELEPSWAEAWITLGRAQLNFGEPDTAFQSFDRALAIKPDSKEAQDDKRTALNLIKRRKQLHLSGLSTNTNRYVVGDKSENS